ncbi:Clr5 domain-containing protein [Xylariales sp. AK1849]|nr:Clr5 domain-containing protein [Xylariales sp. AK1849]
MQCTSTSPNGFKRSRTKHERLTASTGDCQPHQSTRLRGSLAPMARNSSTPQLGTAVLALRPETNQHSSSPTHRASSASFLPPATDRRPHFPTGDHEWEALKPIIEDLCINENQPLPLVAHTMKTVHGFKASERMYKSRFAKWRWKKSNEARALQSTRLGRELTKHLGRNSIARQSRGDNGFYSRGARMLMHESQSTFFEDTAMRSYRDYTISWAETDPRWHIPNKYQSLDITCKPFTMLSDLRMATLYLINDDPIEGGRFLRLAFLSIEQVVRDDHLHEARDLFIWCPLRIFNLPQPIADKTIKAYCRSRFRGNTTPWLL